MTTDTPKLSLSALEEDMARGLGAGVHKQRALLSWAKRIATVLPELLDLLKENCPLWNHPGDAKFPYAKLIKEGDKLLPEFGE